MTPRDGVPSLGRATAAPSPLVGEGWGGGSGYCGKALPPLPTPTPDPSPQGGGEEVAALSMRVLAATRGEGEQCSANSAHRFAMRRACSARADRSRPSA